MICTSCKKEEAVVFIKQLFNNQVSQSALCASCAAHAHVAADPADELLELLSGIGHPRPRASALRCPGCQTTFEDFRTSGRFGCSRCYDHFNQQIKPLLPRMHAGAYEHRGKNPKTRP